MQFEASGAVRQALLRTGMNKVTNKIQSEKTMSRQAPNITNNASYLFIFYHMSTFLKTAIIGDFDYKMLSSMFLVNQIISPSLLI